MKVRESHWYWKSSTSLSVLFHCISLLFLYETCSPFRVFQFFDCHLCACRIISGPFHPNHCILSFLQLYLRCDEPNNCSSTAKVQSFAPGAPSFTVGSTTGHPQQTGDSVQLPSWLHALSFGLWRRMQDAFGDVLWKPHIKDRIVLNR